MWFHKEPQGRRGVFKNKNFYRFFEMDLNELLQKMLMLLLIKFLEIQAHLLHVLHRRTI